MPPQPSECPRPYQRGAFSRGELWWPRKASPQDLGKASSHALVQMQTFPNEWHRRAGAPNSPGSEVPALEAVAQLKALAESTVRQPAIQLRILLTQYAVGGLNEPRRVRASRWRIRIRCYEPGRSSWRRTKETPSEPLLARFGELARTDPSPVVRLYLALGIAAACRSRRRDGISSRVWSCSCR